MADTLRLGGITLSDELVQLDILDSGSSNKRFLALLQRVASARVAIPNLHQGLAGGKLQSTICLTAEDFASLSRDPDGELDGRWCSVRRSIGTISLFPHRFDLALYGRLINVLHKRGIPVHGMSSSVSALVIHTDYNLLEDGVAAILTLCHLPDNHTPLRPVPLLDGQAVETVAVYWEPRIRIYGMDIQRGLSLLQLECDPEAFAHDQWLQLGAQQEKFRLLVTQAGEKRRSRCTFLIQQEHHGAIRAALSGLPGRNFRARLITEERADMVSFHGPHFHDRYGIAELAYSSLKTTGCRLLASGCTGTSVTIVVAGGQAETAAEKLRQICIVP
ncbi:MAG: hypothetical protein ABR512_06780 [Desulfopila sp.]